MGERRVVAHRPEPPSDEPAAPKLSRDEVHALLAVTGTTNRASRRTLRRGGVALMWFALPLVRQRRDGWM